MTVKERIVDTWSPPPHDGVRPFNIDELQWHLEHIAMLPWVQITAMENVWRHDPKSWQFADKGYFLQVRVDGIPDSRRLDDDDVTNDWHTITNHPFDFPCRLEDFYNQVATAVTHALMHEVIEMITRGSKLWCNADAYSKTAEWNYTINWLSGVISGITTPYEDWVKT